MQSAELSSFKIKTPRGLSDRVQWHFPVKNSKKSASAEANSLIFDIFLI